MLDWLSDNSLESVADQFLQMGVYQHEDLVNLACGLRRSGEFRLSLQRGLNIAPHIWLSMEGALMRYARPFKYTSVKVSVASVDPDGRFEYLFDDAAWDRKLQEVQGEAGVIRDRTREEWIDSMCARTGDNVTVKTEVKIEVKMEEL